MQFDPLGEAEFMGETAPARANDPERVRLIEQQPGSKAIFELDDLSKG